jgi:hypothetical protein
VWERAVAFQAGLRTIDGVLETINPLFEPLHAIFEPLHFGLDEIL